MTNQILAIVIANSVPFIIAIYTLMEVIRTKRRLAVREGREMDIKEAASSLDGWKKLNEFLMKEVSRGNDDRDRLWGAQRECESLKTVLEKRVNELEGINKDLVKEVGQLKEQVKVLLEKLKQ